MLSRRKFIRQSSVAGLGFRLAPAGRLFAAENHQFGYQSGFIKLMLDAASPRLDYFSTDSLGQGRFMPSPLLPRVPGQPAGMAYRSEVRGSRIAYYTDAGQTPAWEFRCAEKKIEIRTRWVEGRQVEPFPIVFSQKLNHSTVLGVLAGKNELRFPCVLHLPGMGSFRVYCGDPGPTLWYDADRFSNPGEKGEPFVEMKFQGAGKAHPDIMYTLESAAIFPDLGDRHTDPRYDGYRRNYINIFQLNPRMRVLANNSASDACAMTLYFYTEMARKTPELAKGLAAMDLVRHSLDRYLSGFKGYGQVGYDTPIGWNSEYDSSDSAPSLIISACYYIQDTGDRAWAEKNYAGIKAWADRMMATDTDHNGLVEYGYPGNEGSWSNHHRPANWWDAIGFGHEDAYSNAVAYRALTLLAVLAKSLGNPADETYFGKFATKLRSNYYKTFYHAETGLLTGWKSADGQLHDYCFTFVNSVAIHYGLLEEEQAQRIMTALLAKMKAVGYTDFSLGLPGNLVPIRPGDYTDHNHRWGYGSKEDGSDGFQKYENGGATGCYAYYMIQALKQLGHHAAADDILYPMLKSYKEGGFEGACAGSKMTKDWKTWTGECWGYEGFLVDNYLTFLAV